MTTDFKINLGGSIIVKVGDDIIPLNHGDWVVDTDGVIPLLPPALANITAQRLYLYLSLRYGEYFVDTTKGFPYVTYSMYKNSTDLFDNAMKEYILSVEGVKQLIAYRSELDKSQRKITVTFDVECVNGQIANIQVVL